MAPNFTPAAQNPGAKTARQPAVTALTITQKHGTLLFATQAGVFYRGIEAKEHTSLGTKLDHVHALRFAADGKTLAIAGGTPAESGSVELWSWPERKLLGSIDGHEDVVHDLVWLDQGRRFVAASADRMVRLWDATNRRESHKFTGHSGPVLALAVSADERMLCSGSADHTVRVWETGSGKPLRALTNHLGPVHALAFRPQGQGPATLASAGGDATVRIWQPDIGRLVRIIRHPAPVFCLAWSSDGSKLFTGAQDGILRVIDGDSDRILEQRQITPERINCLVVDSARIVAGTSNGTITFQSRDR